MIGSLVPKIRRRLARHWSPKLLIAKPHAPMLSISFDDCPKSAWIEGGAVLRDHGVRATYYVCGDLCGRFFDGVDMYEETDLVAMHEAGHEVGSHCFQHVSCLRQSPAQLRRSFQDNEAFIRERLGDVRLVSLAYPYGEVSLSAKWIAHEAFSSARGVVPGVNGKVIDLTQLKAVGLGRDRRQAADVEPFIEDALRRKGWLIIYSHDVCDSPGDFGCAADVLDRIIRIANAAKFEILPVKAALAACAFAGA